MALPVRPPFEPMLAKLTRDMPPDGADLLFEPKWDGFRCVVFRDGDDLDLQSRNQKPLLRYFPEMREPLLAQLPDQVVLDGELVIATPDGLDFDALQLRQHPAESRVQKLAAEIPASYVAFDLLALGGESLLDEPFRDRARRPRATARQGGAAALPHARDDEPRAGVEWFDAFEGAGFDGVVAKPLGDPYQPGARTMLKVKHERTCDCVVAGYRMHKDGNGRRLAAARPLRRRRRAAPRRRRERDGREAAHAAARRGAAAAQERARGAPVARLGRSGRRGGRERAADAGRPEPLERDQGHVVGAAAHRARVRGRVRGAAQRPVPPQRALPALARRQGPRRLHVRAARGRRPGRAAARCSRRPADAGAICPFS